MNILYMGFVNDVNKAWRVKTKAKTSAGKTKTQAKTSADQDLGQVSRPDQGQGLK